MQSHRVTVFDVFLSSFTGSRFPFPRCLPPIERASRMRKIILAQAARTSKYQLTLLNIHDTQHTHGQCAYDNNLGATARQFMFARIWSTLLCLSTSLALKRTLQGKSLVTTYLVLLSLYCSSGKKTDNSSVYVRWLYAPLPFPFLRLLLAVASHLAVGGVDTLYENAFSTLYTSIFCVSRFRIVNRPSVLPSLPMSEMPRRQPGKEAYPR